MPDNDITTALEAARAAYIDADISVEDGMIRVGVDRRYRFHDTWTEAVKDLVERVAAAVAAWRVR